MELEPYSFAGNFSAHTFKDFLVWAVEQGASDILVQGGDYIWFEIHGRQHKATTHTIQQGHLPTLIHGLWQADVEAKIRAGEGADRALELTERDGIDVPRGRALRFRCNFTQARVAGMETAFAITMRTIPDKLPKIEDQNLDSDLFESLYPGMGLGLICGPTGSGKSTLLAAMYRHSGEVYPNRKVITYEDPIEFVLGGRHWKGPQPAQSEIGRDIPDFASGLRNAMRRKPSIVGIGEARDLETVDAMIEASLTGHLCYATVHTESVAETINRIIQVYPPEAQSNVASRLVGALRFICIQRLLKTTDGKRTAIREYVVFDRSLRSRLSEVHHTQWAAMIRRLLEEAKATLDDHAWDLFEEGRIDKEEFIELAGYREFNTRLAESDQNRAKKTVREELV